MPELPEVETSLRGIEPYTKGLPDRALRAPCKIHFITYQWWSDPTAFRNVW